MRSVRRYLLLAGSTTSESRSYPVVRLAGASEYPAASPTARVGCLFPTDPRSREGDHLRRVKQAFTMFIVPILGLAVSGRVDSAGSRVFPELQTLGDSPPTPVRSGPGRVGPWLPRERYDVHLSRRTEELVQVYMDDGARRMSHGAHQCCEMSVLSRLWLQYSSRATDLDFFSLPCYVRPGLWCITDRKIMAYYFSFDSSCPLFYPKALQ